MILVMLKKQVKKAGVAGHDAVELGRQLRACRKELSLTMQAVADAAGLSVGFISQVERGLTAPSLGSLVSIAAVLKKPLSHFLEQPASARELTRQSDRVTYKVGGGGLSYERLSTNFPGSTLRSVIVHEPPGHRAEPISHEGEEMFFVLHGEITVEIESHRSILKAGDSIHFDSRKTHSTWNHSTDIASILWCGTMDVFGDGEPDPIHKGNK
jgi:transcriptional regulator with XRE-family HTH domain